jgi:glycosyltransferase involved in cell wall biosynthesis
VITDLVSTIIPVFNRGAMLREAVDSVLAQTWRPIEIIIVDDGSSDDTPQVMQHLQAQHPDIIRLLRQDNAGPGVARQNGLSLAQGEFVQFLDSDDLLLPEKFALQIGGLRSDPEAGIAYGKTWTNEQGVRLAEPAQGTGTRLRTLFPTLLEGPLWPTLTPLYRRSAIERIGPWPTARQLEDWQYDAQAAALGIPLHFVDAFVAETRNHAGERLCHLWQTDIKAMRERARAFLIVFTHAQRARIGRETPEMQRFVRSLFWMARTAGAQGLVAEADALFAIARTHATKAGWDYRITGLLVLLMGWRNASRLLEAIARWRR